MSTKQHITVVSNGVTARFQVPDIDYITLADFGAIREYGDAESNKLRVIHLTRDVTIVVDNGDVEHDLPL